MSYLYYIIRISYSTEQGVSIDATTMIKSCNVVVEKKWFVQYSGWTFLHQTLYSYVQNLYTLYSYVQNIYRKE